MGILYTAVVHSVLLYRSESWVMKGAMLKVLEGFHYWASQRITGMMERRTKSREWEWAPVAEAPETPGL